MHGDLIKIMPEKSLPTRTALGFIQTHFSYTVENAKTNDVTNTECYNEQIS